MTNNKKARVIAFYLPQYHPISENDEWWGKGFTEWTNVGKAKPLFRGHYQPRVPADLGYYDLRMPEIREAQAQMAREAGIEGFMYWHYWFGNGRRLLERVFDEVLESGKPDFPFCLGWANHSWKRKTWDKDINKRGDEILLEQTYGVYDDYAAHFNYVLKAFKDDRYIRINQKPIFYIFDPSFADIKNFINVWQQLAEKNGLNGIHFIGKMDGHLNNEKTILSKGINSINTSRMWIAESNVRGRFLNLVNRNLNEKLGIGFLSKYKYSDIIKYLVSESEYKEYIFPTLLPQWDHSPRSGKKGVIYEDSKPDFFRKHLIDVLKAVENKRDENKIVFLKSWNEWAEGNYVEPDLRWKNAYLEILKDELFK